MTNIEKKKQLWNEILHQYEHLDCKIDVNLDSEDSIYFHPIFTIGENIVIRTLCDIDNGASIYFYDLWYNGDSVYLSFDVLSAEKIERIIQNVEKLEKKLSFLQWLFNGEEKRLKTK